MGPYDKQETPTREALESVVEAYLREAGYRTLHGIRIRTWSPDIVAIKGKELLIIEVRGRQGDLRKAIAQTALYATDASSAYLAVPEGRITGDLEAAARVLGIGLLAAGGDRVERVVKAPVVAPRAALVSRVRRAMRKSPGPVHERVLPSRIPLDRILRHRSILEALLARPGRKFTIRELSAEARTAYATTWRIVGDLVALGAITSERVGPSELLTLRDGSPIVADLRQLRALELAPHRRAAREFARRVSEIPAVERVILFGSVARGREAPGSDVDVAVVTARKAESLRNRVLEIATEVGDRTRMRVVPLILTPREIRSEGQLGESLRSGEVLFERP